MFIATLLDITSRQAIASRDIDALVDYWEKLCPSDDIPLRALFKPMTVASSLEVVVLVRKEADCYRIKLAGEKVEWDGISLRGDPIDEAHFGDLADALIKMYEHCIDTRAPVFFFGEGSIGRKKGQRFAQVILPFQNEDGEIQEFIAAVTYDLFKKTKI